MGHLQIETTQNVSIEYPTANVGLRIVSQILDYLFLFAYAIAMIYLLEAASIRGASILIFFLPVVFYSFIMESFFNGQSFGKMIMKIRVVRLDGSQATLLHYFIRWLFRLIDVHIFYGIVGIVSIAAGNKGQRLGDRAAGTTVVTLQGTYNFKNSVYRAVTEDYQLQFPQVEMLSDTDISTINEVLVHYGKNQGIQAINLMEKARDAIIRKTNIETTMETRAFLRTIVKDYNYILRNETY